MSRTYLRRGVKGSCERSAHRQPPTSLAYDSSGSWLVRHLTVKYPNAYNIVSFDKLDYCSSLNNARMLESKANFNFFHGDVTQPNDVLRCLQKHDIDTVFHLAAHTHVDLSFGNSYNFTKNNVLGTHVLLESIKEFGRIKRFYHVSTDEAGCPAVRQQKPD